MAANLPSIWVALATIASVTLRRLRGGRALWLGVAIAALPIMFAVLMRGDDHFRAAATWGWRIELLVLCVVPPLFVASSIGEEIEDRTTTYLWSRALPRWTVLIGKLIALAPIAVAIVVAGWLAAIKLGLHAAPTAPSAIGLGAGALAISIIAAGIATVVPKHGMALSIAYLGIDFVIGQIPASLQLLSATHQASQLAGMERSASTTSAPAITLAVLAGAWLAIGLWRVRRLES